jgi:hypothetical protein
MSASAMDVKSAAEVGPCRAKAATFSETCNGVLQKPSQTWVRCGPAIAVLGKSRNSAIVNDFAVLVAPAAVDNLIDSNFIDVASDYAIDEASSVSTRDYVLVQRTNVDQCSGVSNSVVLMLVVRFVNADGVIARPFPITQALAECKRSFMKRSSDRHVAPSSSARTEHRTADYMEQWA